MAILVKTFYFFTQFHIFIYYSYIGSYNRRDQSSSRSNLIESGWNERGLHGETLGQQSEEQCAAALLRFLVYKE